MDSILAHKLRSTLTLLGIIIGVGSVVLVGAAIEGLGSYADQTTAKAFGSDSYLVAQVAQVGRATRAERAAKLRRNKRIRPEDLSYLVAATGDQIQYSGYRVRFDDVKAGSLTFEGAMVVGASASLAEIRDVAVEQGRFFTDQEEQNRQFVCVLGNELITTLFEGQSPLGRTVRIRGFDFTVIGTQEKLGSTGGQSQDNQVHMPFHSFSRLYGPEVSMPIFARARPESGLSLASALDVTRVALRTRFKTKPGEDDNFDTMTPDSIRAFVDQVLGLISAIVVPVTCISLIVGGIVVMNIMLVSVTERTREIGIRKALGARRFDIMLQFLTEAVILAASGGLVGLALGVIAARLLGLVLEVDLPVTWPYVALAVAVSTLTGILSGWYPASKASRMDPVEALRHE